jgi:hypothetical protein
LGLLEADLLLMQGLLIVLLLRDPPTDPLPDSPDDPPAGSPDAPPTIGSLGAALIAVALAFAVISGLAATRGLQQLAAIDLQYPSGLMASTILAAALALPLVSTGTPAASHGRSDGPLLAHTLLALLNLCLLIPLIVLIAGRTATPPTLEPMATRPARAFNPILYPRVAWRIDALAILLLSMIFMAVAIGKIRLDRRLGFGLIVLYCVYLFSTLVVGARG